MLSKRFYYFLAIAMFFAQTLFAGGPVVGDWKKRFDCTEDGTPLKGYFVQERAVYLDGVCFVHRVNVSLDGNIRSIRFTNYDFNFLQDYNLAPDGMVTESKFANLFGDEASFPKNFSEDSNSEFSKAAQKHLDAFVQKIQAMKKYEDYFEEGFVPTSAEIRAGKKVSDEECEKLTEQRINAKQRMALFEEKLKDQALTEGEITENEGFKKLFSRKSPSFKKAEELEDKIRTIPDKLDYGLSDREKKMRQQLIEQEEQKKKLKEQHSKELEEKERLKDEELSRLTEEQKQMKKELEQNKTAMEEEKKRLAAEKAQLEAAHLEKIKEYEQHKLEAEEKLKNEQAKALQEKHEAQKRIDAMKANGASQADIDAATADMDKKFKDAEEKMRKEKEESDKALLEEKSKAEKLQKDLEAATAANKEALEKMAKDHDALSKNLEEQKNEIEKTKTEAARLKKEFEEAQNSSAKDKEKLAEIEKKEQEKSDLLKKFKDELPKSPSMTVDQLKSYKSCGLDDLLKAIKESSLDDKTKKELQKNLAQAFELPVQEDSPAGSDSPKPEPWSLPAKIGFVSVGAGALYLGAKLLSRMYVNKNVDAKSSPLNRKEDKKIAEVK